MALVLRGGSAVIWSQHQDAFPYIKGMLVIFLSWVCSPVASGDLSCSDPHTAAMRHSWPQTQAPCVILLFLLPVDLMHALQ